MTDPLAEFRQLVSDFQTTNSKVVAEVQALRSEVTELRHKTHALHTDLNNREQQLQDAINAATEAYDGYLGLKEMQDNEVEVRDDSMDKLLGMLQQVKAMRDQDK